MVDALMAQNLTRTCGLMVCRRMMHRSWVGELGRPSIDFGRKDSKTPPLCFACIEMP